MNFFSLKNLPIVTAGSHVALLYHGEVDVSLDFIDLAKYDSIIKD